MGKPYIQLYKANWRGEPTLKNSSWACQGFWLALILHMDDAEPPGHLVIAGDRLGMNDYARIAEELGGSPQEARKHLEWMYKRGVFDLAPDGTIICRHIVAAAEKREVFSSAGKRGGGSPLLKGRGKTPPPNGESLFDHAQHPASANGASNGVQRVNPKRVADEQIVDLSDLDDVIPAAPVVVDIGLHEFLKWYGTAAIASNPQQFGAHLSPLDFAWFKDGRTFAEMLLSNYTREDCEARARRQFEFCKAQTPKAWRPTLQLLSDRWPQFAADAAPGRNTKPALSNHAKRSLEARTAARAAKNTA